MLDTGRTEQQLLDSHQERLLWETRVGHSTIGEDLLRPDTAAGLAAEAWNRLFTWDLDLSDVHPRAGVEARAFLEWARGFEAECETSAWLDRARLPARIISSFEGGDLGLPSCLVLAGFEELPPVIARMATSLQGLGVDVLNLAPPRREANIQRLGLIDADRELEAAASWWMERLREEPDARLGIVIPDLAQRRSTIVHCLDGLLHPDAATSPRAPGQRLYNLSLGLPLSDTPAVRDALVLLQLMVSGLEFGDLSMLLRSPFLGDADHERRSRSILDAAVRRRPEDRITAHRLIRASSESCPALAQRLTDALKCFEGTKASASAWSNRFRDTLSSIGWPGDRALDSEEYQQVERFRDLVDQYPMVGAIRSRLNASQAVNHLADMARHTTFQSETRLANPIQVMGLLEADGQSFDGLWITGMSDQQFPPSSEPHPLLPLSLQRAHNMPHASPERELAFSRHQLERLLAAAPEIRISWPERDGERDLMPSPLVLDLPEIAAKSSLLSDAASQWLGAQSLIAIHDAEGTGVAENTEVRGGARLLYDQAACPFRAYARHRLAADSLGEPEAEPSPLTRGNLLHKALEHLWRELDGSARLHDLNDEELDSQIAVAVGNALTEFDLSHSSHQLERNRLIRRLTQWLEIERLRAPFEVAAVENRREITLGGLRITTQADRIDKLEDDRMVVIDYKSGAARRDGWFGERLFEPQLPLYAVSAVEGELAAVTLAQLKTGDLRFVGATSEKSLLPKINAISGDRASGDIDHWQDLMEHWEAGLSQLAAEVRQGLAVVAPQYTEACAYCDLGDLCRVALSNDDVEATSSFGEDNE